MAAAFRFTAGTADFRLPAGIPRLARQRGAALLLFTFLVLIFGASVFVSAWNGRQAVDERRRTTEKALFQAKEALLGYAARHATLPGRLVCPEQLSVGSPVEGQAQSTCTTTAARLGRFPWATLKTERLTDPQGEPLWYAVSPGFSSSPINAGTPGQLQVDGVANIAAAIIIAPGAPLTGQSRTTPSPTTPPQAANYLDLGNAGGVAFVTGGPATTFNDQVLVVTQAEWAKAVGMRVLAEVRGPDDQAPALPNKGLRRYRNDNGSFPFADNNADGLADPGQLTGPLAYNELYFDTATLTWLNNSGWLSLVSYTRQSTNSALISLGGAQMKVVPCTSLPCP